MSWNTKFVQKFPCRLPIMGAPMAGPSGGSLAAATCRAGGLGFIAAGHNASTKDLEDQIKIFREEAPSDAPLCIGFISYSSLGSVKGWKSVERVLQTHRPKVVQFFAPAIITSPTRDSKSSQTNVELAHEYDALVLAQVGNTRDGLAAVEAGVDGIIAQGSEAGGHGLRPGLGSSTASLASNLIQNLCDYKYDPSTIPILAAGGIVDGPTMAAAMTLGCDGVVLGTRLWATRQALGRDTFKQALVDASFVEDAVRTTVFDQILNATSNFPWPQPYDSLGALRNDISTKWDNSEDRLAAELAESSPSTETSLPAAFQRAQQTGDNSTVPVLAGKGVANISSIESADDVIERINQDAIATIHALPGRLFCEPTTSS